MGNRAHPPPSPTLGGDWEGGGGFSCPLLLGKCWGRAEELRGWCWDCVPSPSPPPVPFFTSSLAPWDPSQLEIPTTAWTTAGN